MVDALVSHITRKHASIPNQTGCRNPHVVINLEDLALERAELRRRALESRYNYVSVALQKKKNMSAESKIISKQQRGLTLHPAQALPCLTASIASAKED